MEKIKTDKIPHFIDKSTCFGAANDKICENNYFCHFIWKKLKRIKSLISSTRVLDLGLQTTKFAQNNYFCHFTWKKLKRIKSLISSTRVLDLGLQTTKV